MKKRKKYHLGLSENDLQDNKFVFFEHLRLCFADINRLLILFQSV